RPLAPGLARGLRRLHAAHRRCPSGLPAHRPAPADDGIHSPAQASLTLAHSRNEGQAGEHLPAAHATAALRAPLTSAPTHRPLPPAAAGTRHSALTPRPASAARSTPPGRAGVAPSTTAAP